jgi:predicted nucleic acid-binding protein
MAKVSRYFYVDSCVFISYFNNHPNRADLIEQFFDAVRNNPDEKLVTSTLTITEVAHIAQEKEKWRLQTDVEEKIDLFWQEEALIEFVEVNELIARQARTLIRQAIQKKYALKPPDAIHLASARFVGAGSFVTYDNLEKYASLITIEVIEPRILQPRLLSDDS